MGVMGKKLSSLKCEVRIVEARNVEIKSQASTLFVRFYLSTEQNRKIEVNTREICSKTENLIWDQSFGLECQGNEAAIEELKQQRVVFELRRRRKTTSFLRKSSRSEVVGRGEVSWESVFESPGMEMERFVVMGESKNRVVEDGKPVLLKICLKVQALDMEKMMINKKEKRLEKLCVCCSSRDCGSCSCLDFEAFALTCALDCI